MAESFMRTLKHEEIDGQSYRDLADAQARVETFNEKVYNPRRLHSSLAYRSLLVFEDKNRPPPQHAAAVEAVNATRVS